MLLIYKVGLAFMLGVAILQPGKLSFNGTPLYLIRTPLSRLCTALRVALVIL